MLRRKSSKKAFSLVEMAVTFFIAALISTAVIVVLQGSAKPGADTAAKASLIEVSKIQSSFYNKNKRTASIQEMSSLDTSLSYTELTSTSPLTVSLGLTNSSVYAAVSAEEGSCWLLQLNYDPTPEQNPQIWAVSDNIECGYAFASLLVPSGTEVGSSSSRPQNIVTVN